MISDLFKRIEELLAAPPTVSSHVQGWCDIHKATTLAAIVVALRPAVVVEAGVFGGRSLLPMALACQALGHGVVFGIDPWSPQASSEGYTGENQAWWATIDHDAVYARFTSHLHRLGLFASGRVNVLRMKSDDAPVPPEIDVLHLDSQHTEQVLREIDRFGSKVRQGGIIVLDDLEWQNLGVSHVAIGVTKLLELGFIELSRTKSECGTWGVFQRIS